MACLDSDFVIAAIRKNQSVASAYAELASEQSPLKTTIITSCELYHGAYKTGSSRNVKAVREILSTLEILPLSTEAAQIFGRLNAGLQTQGKTVDGFDLLIASICIANNETLVTRNGKHFEKIKELETKKW